MKRHIVVSQHDLKGSRMIPKPNVEVVKSNRDLMDDPRSVDIGFHTLGDLVDMGIYFTVVAEDHKLGAGEVLLEVSENDMISKLVKAAYDSAG